MNLHNLNKAQAKILLAMAEVIVGQDFTKFVPSDEFIVDIDDLMNYQTEAKQKALKLGLKTIQSYFLRGLGLGIWTSGKFTKMTLEKRQGIFRKLQEGETENQRYFYLGFVNLVSSTFYGHEHVWGPELQYEGVSVDDQCILQGHPWRSGGPDVEKCDPNGPC